MGMAAYPLWNELLRSFHHSIVAAVLDGLSTVLIGFFWMAGVKDLVYTIWYRLIRKNAAVPAYQRESDPRVVLVYATYNDFSEESLRASMNQHYGNYKVVILDDSTDPEYFSRVDSFAESWHIDVIRRKDRSGFKAGNLNNYLRNAEYDYFVILDSDEIIPPEFITRSLDYFDHYGNVGIVQANHRASRNRNAFMKLFSIGVDSNWTAYQTVKSSSGFLTLLGHGAMVSKACYEAAGGFPHLVAEDLSFSIKARDAGYFAVFAPDIICEEEYPVSYLAFKKRHAKWTQGNVEFVTTYTGTILRSPMRWFEKLDIMLFVYNLLPFYVYVIVNSMVLPYMHYRVLYPLWMLVPTVLFLFAPTFNDILYYWRRGILFLGWYVAHSMLLYGSMFFIGVISAGTALLGKATFLVTPKSTGQVTHRFAFRANQVDLLLAILVTVASIAFTGSFLPVILIVLPTCFSLYMTRMHNHRDVVDQAERSVGGGMDVTPVLAQPPLGMLAERSNPVELIARNGEWISVLDQARELDGRRVER
jgi:cellulose synthase/poly-beta-1,6-N-acetylglucosamine synthase-like glycosyltransferase